MLSEVSQTQTRPILWFHLYVIPERQRPQWLSGPQRILGREWTMKRQAETFGDDGNGTGPDTVCQSSPTRT